MRLAQHLTALCAWCKQSLPGRWKPDVLRPGIRRDARVYQVWPYGYGQTWVWVHHPPPRLLWFSAFAWRMSLGRDSVWDGQVQINYLSSVSTLAFTTLEHSHNKQCRVQMARTVAKYLKAETALGQERETRWVPLFLLECYKAWPWVDIYEHYCISKQCFTLLIYY